MYYLTKSFVIKLQHSDETGRLILETDVMTLHHMYYVIILIVICSLCQQHVFGALIISIKNQFR